MAITIKNTGMSPSAFSQALSAAVNLSGTTRQTLTISGGELTVPLTAQWPRYRVELSGDCQIVVTYPEGADTDVALYGAEIEFTRPLIGGPFTATPPRGWSHFGDESAISLSAVSAPMLVSLESWTEGAGTWAGAKLSAEPYTLPDVVDAAYLQALIPSAIIFDTLDPASGRVFSDADGLIATNPATDRRVRRWNSYGSPSVFALAGTEATSQRLVRTTSTQIYLSTGVVGGSVAKPLNINFATAYGDSCSVCRAGLEGPEITSATIGAGNFNVAPETQYNARVVLVNEPWLVMSVQKRNAILDYLGQMTPELGASPITNPSFIGPSSTGWTTSNWTINDGHATLASEFSPSVNSLSWPNALNAGNRDKMHVVELDYLSPLANMVVELGGTAGFNPQRTFAVTEPVAYKSVRLAGTATFTLRIANTDVAVGGGEYVTNVRVREVL